MPTEFYRTFCHTAKARCHATVSTTRQSHLVEAAMHGVNRMRRRCLMCHRPSVLGPDEPIVRLDYPLVAESTQCCPHLNRSQEYDLTDGPINSGMGTSSSLNSL